MDPLQSIISTSASGMYAQSSRLKVISENVANANSTASEPGGDPYRRKTISFKEMVDKETGSSVVKVDKISEDKSDFKLEFDPNHPASDENGYVKMPNVNTLIEMTDMREASRSYEANLNMLNNGRSMKSKLVSLLR
jgi:flagellar basal-body rod protein FlgC